MFRDDYEKFIKIVIDVLLDYYFLQNIYTEKYFYYNYSKIRDCRTIFVERTDKDININHGVFIDIFPLDVYPESWLKQKYIKVAERFANSIIGENYYNFNLNSEKELLINKVAIFFQNTKKCGVFLKKNYLKV